MTLMTLLMIKIMMMMVQVRQRFYNHEDFMLELQSHQGAVRKVFVTIMIITMMNKYLSIYSNA